MNLVLRPVYNFISERCEKRLETLSAGTKRPWLLARKTLRFPSILPQVWNDISMHDKQQP